MSETPTVADRVDLDQTRPAVGSDGARIVKPVRHPGAPMSETMTELKPDERGRALAGEYADWLAHGNSTGSLSPHAVDALAIHFTQALSAAEARGREAAAKWHDDAAADARERSRQARMDGATSIIRLTFDLTAQSHDTYAAAIRKGLTP